MNGNTVLHGIPEVEFGRIQYRFQVEDEILISTNQNQMTLDEFNLHMIYLNDCEKQFIDMVEKEN